MLFVILLWFPINRDTIIYILWMFILSYALGLVMQWGYLFINVLMTLVKRIGEIKAQSKRMCLKYSVRDHKAKYFFFVMQVFINKFLKKYLKT